MIKPAKYGLFLFLAILAFNCFILFFSLSLISLFQIGYFGTLLFGLTGAIVSSAGVTVIVIFGAPALRYFLFNFRRFLRLENLSHPLMIKLSSEAPGTYQHSLMVSNIAYRTAKIIGANGLLCRISSYYHDIGKIKSPQHFVENQSHESNIHDQLNHPKKSAKIIISHVKEGVELARENHLPPELIEIIEQHHGSSLVNYFYKKALEENAEVDQKEFRYAGPKPMNKEAAIVMLADSLEAQIRLQPKLNQEIIAGITRRVIEEKMNDKQLELAQISMPELKKIEAAMIEALKIIFHHRIEY